MSYQIRQYGAKNVVVSDVDVKQLLGKARTLFGRMGRDKASACSMSKALMLAYDDGATVFDRKADMAKAIGVTLRTLQLYAAILDELEPFFLKGANMDVLRKLSQLVNDGDMTIDRARELALCNMSELRKALDVGTDGETDDVTGDAETATDRVAAAIAIVQAMTPAERASFDALYKAL